MKITDTPQFQAKKETFLIPVEPDKVFDFNEMFHNQNPVYLEIGSGKGEFISEYPLLHKDWNFIGFELKQKRVDIILRKLDPEQHQNVRLATFMIDANIEKMITPQSISGVFIQHPDPWPKRKHFKRRLFQPAFLDALSRIIKTGGFIQVSTDHAEYAQWIAKGFIGRNDYRPVNENVISNIPLLDEHITTYYEIGQRRLGFEPKFLLYEKCL